ncbi:MAG: disulfide bond formation protein B [Pseudomonadota bacterium]|jgi:disulfide bond formation protein DsbB|nr:disulfide bond formation protein B [Pseudomonadota bacterium]QKK05159.1 MAG: disulfide bond formation protein B [Pseudomonadota bacterium]|tara:strand:+ start:320 stop:979 length:660 start_codon:yes stop_codon:yes gene_type:complete
MQCSGLPQIDTRLAAILLMLGSAAMLLGALFFQEVMNLPPCPLCIYQRVPYIVVIGLSVPAILLRGCPALIMLALSALALYIDAGIAGFHVGVEKGWWEGLGECSGNFNANMTIEELRAAVLDAPIVRCTEVPWSLFGISMAGYNMVIATAMAIFATLSVCGMCCKDTVCIPEGTGNIADRPKGNAMSADIGKIADKPKKKKAKAAKKPVKKSGKKGKK